LFHECSRWLKGKRSFLSNYRTTPQTRPEPMMRERHTPLWCAARTITDTYPSAMPNKKTRCVATAGFGF
jgi:hypothetical protein